MYTAAVNSGAYKNFVHDSAGYGLAQWTHWSRKEALLDYAKAQKASIGDLDMQLNFFWKEISGYKTLLNTLKTATSVYEASTAFMVSYERPANQSESNKQKRAELGQCFYDEFEKFWDLNQHKVKQIYFDIQQEDDIVVSGCPYCLLKIICDRIGIKHYIGSDIDPVKGEINSICYKEHKLEVFRSVYGDVIIDDFYTDSMADKPMMDISENVFMVDGEKITQIKKDGVTI